MGILDRFSDCMGEMVHYYFGVLWKCGIRFAVCCGGGRISIILTFDYTPE